MDKPMIKQHATRRKPSLKKLIIVSAIGVILIVAGLILWQYLAWQRATDTNSQTYQAAVVSAKEQLNTINQASDVARITESLRSAHGEMCQTSPIIDIRLRLSANARDYQAECVERQDKLASTALIAEDVSGWLAEDKKLSEQLTSLAGKQKSLKDGDHAAATKLWRDMDASLDSVEVSEVYQPIFDSLRRETQQIVIKYEKLQKADASKRRVAFDDAAVELRDAYGALDKVSDQSEVAYRELSVRLAAAINDL